MHTPSFTFKKIDDGLSQIGIVVHDSDQWFFGCHLVMPREFVQL